MRQRYVLAIMLMSAAGCESGLLDPGEQRSLVAAETNWKRAALSS